MSTKSLACCVENQRLRSEQLSLVARATTVRL
jgi:hypothetical protein